MIPSGVCIRCKVRRPLDLFPIGEDGITRRRVCLRCIGEVLDTSLAAAFTSAAESLHFTPQALALHCYATDQGEKARAWLRQ